MLGSDAACALFDDEIYKHVERLRRYHGGSEDRVESSGERAFSAHYFGAETRSARSW